jgi:alpha-glucuronidase
MWVFTPPEGNNQNIFKSQLDIHHQLPLIRKIESGLDGWLRYAELPTESRKTARHYSGIIVLDRDETSPGLNHILGQRVDIDFELPSQSSSLIVVGTIDSFSAAGGNIKEIPALKEDGFWLDTHADNNCTHIIG